MLYFAMFAYMFMGVNDVNLVCCFEIMHRHHVWMCC